jgi:hypothetical protein
MATVSGEKPMVTGIVAWSTVIGAEPRGDIDLGTWALRPGWVDQVPQ